MDNKNIILIDERKVRNSLSRKEFVTRRHQWEPPGEKKLEFENKTWISRRGGKCKKQKIRKESLLETGV